MLLSMKWRFPRRRRQRESTDMDNAQLIGKILSLSGLCRRAGGVVPGADAVISAIKRGGRSMPTAVIMSKSATDRTKKQIGDKTSHAGVELFCIDADPFEIGEKLGMLSACAVYALTGKGPAKQVRELARQAAGNGEEENK